MADDPLQGNQGATNARIEQLKQINKEGAQAKATLEGLASAFKNLGEKEAQFAERAVKSSNEIAGQVRNFSKSYKQNIDLAKQLSGFTTNQLKDSKTRAAFEKQVLKAEAEQAQVQAQIADLRDKATDLAAEMLTNEKAIEAQVDKVKEAEDQVTAAKQQQTDLTKQAEAERKKASDAAFESQKKSEDLAKQIAFLSTEEGRAQYEQQKGRKATQGEIAKIIAQKKQQLATEQENIEVQKEQMAAADKMKADANNAVKAAEDRLEAEIAVKDALIEQQDDLAAQLVTTDMMIENLEEAAKEIEKGLNHAKGLSDEIEAINNATPAFIEAFQKFKGIASSIPIVGDVLNAVTGDISEAADMFKKLRSEGKSSFDAIIKAGKGFIKLGLATAATAFVDAAVKGFMRSSEVMVTLNKSVAGSMVDMSAQSARVASAASRMTVPLEEAAATIGGINEALGMSLDFTQETTDQAIKLTNKYGLGVDTTAKLVKLSAANKDTMTETVDAITAGVAQFNAMNGVSISTKAIFDDIAHASATTLNGIGKQPGAIAAAAAAARSLGMSMEDIRSAAETTTDFQASLTSEMQTEMMLGKQLNLNKLREAALTGDVKTQAEEMKRLVMENAGRIGNNVKLQEQFASTLGISRDQYNEMLKTQDAMSVLTGKSGAAEEANAKTRKMSQEEVAKSIEDSTAKLTTLAGKIDKFKEGISSGAANFANDILKGFEEGGFIGGITNAFSMAFDAVIDAFNGKFTGSKAGALLGALTVAGGAVVTIKTAKGLWNGAKSLLGLGKKKGMDNVEVINGAAKVTMAGGVDLGDGLTRSLGKAGFFKQVKTLFKKPQVFFRALKMKGGFLGKQIGRIGTMFSKMKLPNLTRIFSKIKLPNLGNIFSKIKLPNMTNVFSKLKFPTGAASGILKTVGGKILAPLELAMGAFKGVNQVKDLTAEQKKEQGIREDMGTVEAGVLGALTGNANKGSSLSKYVGIEEGGAADEAMGIAASGARGAMVGAAIGSIIPGVGTAIGGAVGGAVGVIAEGFKVFSDPNSKLRQGITEFATNTWDKAKEIGSKVKEKAVEVGNQIKDFAVGVKDKALEFGAKAKEGIVNFATGVAEKATAFKDAAKEKIGNFASAVGNGIMSFANSARDKAKAFAGAVGEKIGSIRGKISEFVEANGGLVGGIKAAAAGLASKASEWFGSKVQGLKDWWNGDATKTVTNEIKEAEIKKAVAPAVKMSADQSRKFTEALNTALAKGAEVTTKAVNQVGEVLESPLGENATAANNTLNELKRLKEEGDRQHQKELMELRNQTALLYEYITKPQKSVIKMNTFKVGQSLTTV